MTKSEQAKPVSVKASPQAAKVVLKQLDKNEKIEKLKTDLLVIGVYEDSFPKDKDAKLTGLLSDLNNSFNSEITKLAQQEQFQAKLATTLVINSLERISPKKILLIGLGAKKDLNKLDQIRKATASAARRADSLKAENVTFILYGNENKLADSDVSRAITEISLLAPYKFNKYLNNSKDSSSKQEDKKFDGIKEINLVFPTESSKKEFDLAKAEVEKGIAGAEGVLLARELIIEPPNIVNPEYLAKVAERVTKEQKDSDLTVKVLGESECRKLGMGAFLAVGQGSENESKLIHFHYKPKKAKKHIAIVGKGITFDSGGLSLKPAKSMEKMKYDMAGSAAVIGLMSIVSKIKPDVEITAVVAACENMPSGASYRPGDVLTSMSGKTIEINNTDAEGRVTLADSVYYACQQKPDAVIDIATLTGAVVVALGETAAGLMTNNPEFADKVKKAFEQSGEKVWELPLYEDYEDDVVKGTIADMINSGSGGQAGSQNGALFVKQFVGETPWVHLDIAGICWPEKRDTHHTPRNNPSGFGVLGFMRYLEGI